jgi:hypothetical protein
VRARADGGETRASERRAQQAEHGGCAQRSPRPSRKHGEPATRNRSWLTHCLRGSWTCCVIFLPHGLRPEACLLPRAAAARSGARRARSAPREFRNGIRMRHVRYVAHWLNRCSARALTPGTRGGARPSRRFCLRRAPSRSQSSSRFPESPFFDPSLSRRPSRCLQLSIVPILHLSSLSASTPMFSTSPLFPAITVRLLPALWCTNLNTFDYDPPFTTQRTVVPVETSKPHIQIFHTTTALSSSTPAEPPANLKALCTRTAALLRRLATCWSAHIVFLEL